MPEGRMPLKVVFASVHAGGGHNTVRDALVRSVTRLDPHYRRIVPMTWTAANGFDTFYRFCVRLGVQGLVFWLTNFSFSAWLATVLNPRLLLEVLNLLRVQRPDVVVSTHVQLSACFQLARLLLRSRVRLINVIPDYGVPTPAFFPRHRALRADATLVNGEDTFQSLESVAEAHELYRIGTLVSEPFEVLAQSSAIKSKPAVAKEQWKRELAATSPDIARLETNKPIVTFFGGSGFARGCQPVIERLMTHEGLGTQFSIVVLAGRDSQFETELLTRYGGRPGFFVLGFLSHDALSRLYALTDVPVMGSLAHSTLQEMLETRCGPLLIHRVIPGTEPPYVDFVERERLGLYEPEPEAMARLVLESVGVGQASLKLRSLKAEFAKRAVRLRDEHRRLAPKLLGHIERVAGVEPRRLPATGVSDGAAAVGARRSMSLDDIPTSE